MKLYVILMLIAISVLAVACSSTTQNGLDVTADAANTVLDNSATDQEQSENAPIPADASLALDPAFSTLAWHSSKIVGGDHTGEVMVESGNLVFANNELISGDFVIDMTSISDDDGSDALVGHLKNEDFFDVETHPQSTFMITSATKINEGQYDVVGDLTIKGITNEISFPAMFEYSEADGSLMAKASFIIDRTRWGINFNSGSIIKDLGDKAIKDEIDFELDLVFTEN